MSATVVLGAGVGLGLFLLVRGSRRRALPIDELLRALERPAAAPRSQRSAPVARLVQVVEGRSPATLEADLRVADQTAERLAVAKLTGALVGAGAPIALHLLLLAQGGGLARGLLLVAVVGGAALGFTMPDIQLRSTARRRRLQFEHALSSYLDLVNVVLAGGAGIESALEAAADAGDGWVFEELRDALVRARATRRSPWIALGELGSALGVEPLTELAASVQLAGEQGARIRSSLTAKAAALRSRQSAQLEADAHAASERMGVPTVLMFVGFLILLGFPALQQIAGPEPASNPTHIDTEVATTWTP
ncbi:MAG: type II secretion system F family protein [Acidimicrobiia bacterium]